MGKGTCPGRPERNAKCAPRLHEDLVDYYPKDRMQNKLVREYSDQLEKKIIETVAHSFGDLSPARLMMGEGTASFAVNRRNNVESDVPVNTIF